MSGGEWGKDRTEYYRSGEFQSMRREVAEIAIMRDQRKAMIDTRLRNESVGKIRFVSLFDQPRAKNSGAMPESVMKFEHGKAADVVDQSSRQSGIAQGFAYDGWWEARSPLGHGCPNKIDVRAGFAGQEAAQRAGVDGDQSFRSSSSETDHFTLPAQRSSRLHAC